LGTTWFVESLTVALELSHLRGAGLRFVTAECQLIDSDGSITIGSLQSGLGLVSRRSEMQAADEQIDHLQTLLVQAKSTLEQTQREQLSATEKVRNHQQNVFDTERLIESLQDRISHLDRRLEELIAEHSTKQNEISEQLQNQSGLQGLLHESLAKLSQLGDQSLQLAEALEQTEREQEEFETQNRELQIQLVDQRVAAARIEQRIDGLTLTLEQLLNDSQERHHHVQTAKDSLESLASRIVQTQNSIEVLRTELSEQEEQLIDLQHQRTAANETYESQKFQLQNIQHNRDSIQRQIDKWTDRLATYQQEQNRIGQEIQSFVARYQNDYQIDLDSIELNPLDDQDATLDRYGLESQINNLRQEIQMAGSVNLEALEELEQLQSRYDTLSGHEKDLLETKATLTKTMQKIDADSQFLFVETLEKIRSNFQTLYRKSFGGGHADIVLENPEDPESGIEILATPPGKTTFSNNLLSGGEKALTAVSLIMAFFQHRPSPFCVLDEVDAPFDEANIGRFVSVLNEFLDSTKFIIVSHSKKTMTAADMIYGITMQESGVSRQVSVKFEEVDDHGQIIRRDSKAA
jgi:chromosome segregation protein